MANLRSTVNELNAAIETLKAECASHEICTECPMNDNCETSYCYVKAPCNWETIKDGEHEHDQET